MLRAVGGYGDRFPCHGACLWELKEAFVRREVSSSPGSVLCDPSPSEGWILSCWLGKATRAPWQPREAEEAPGSPCGSLWGSWAGWDDPSTRSLADVSQLRS